MGADVTVGSRLASKLMTFYDGLLDYERFNLHLLMSVAVGGIAPHGDVPASGLRHEAWQTGLEVLAHISPSGLAYVGHPDFIEADYLPQLVREASAQQAIAHRTGPQELSPGGTVACQLAGDARLVALVSNAVGGTVEPTLIASYLYYNRAGDHLYPHVDTEIFSVNCIIMIEHTLPDEQADGSALIVYRPNDDRIRVVLKSGDAAVLLASGSVHARETIQEGETVTILTIGFQKVLDESVAQWHA